MRTESRALCAASFVALCLFLPPCFSQVDGDREPVEGSVLAGREVVAALRRSAGEEIWFGAYARRLSCGSMRYQVSDKGRSVELRTEWRTERPVRASYAWTTEWDADGGILRWKEEGRAAGRELAGDLARVDGRLRGRWRSIGGEREWEGELTIDLPAGALPIAAFPLVAPAATARGTRLALVEPWTTNVRAPSLDARGRETLAFHGTAREVDRAWFREIVGCNCVLALTCAAYEGRPLAFRLDERDLVVYVRGTRDEAVKNLPCEPGHEDLVAAAARFLDALARKDSGEIRRVMDPAGTDPAGLSDRIREWIQRFRPIAEQCERSMGALSAGDLAALLGDARREGDRAYLETGFGRLELVQRGGDWFVRAWE